MTQGLNASGARRPRFPRLSAAHVAVGERPALRGVGKRLAEAASGALARTLGQPVQLEPGALEAPSARETALAAASAYALLRFDSLGCPMALELPLGWVDVAMRLLAGASTPERRPVSRLTPLEESALTFVVLEALGALAAVDPERAGDLRLQQITTDRDEVLGWLESGRGCVALSLALGTRGRLDRVRLLMPPEGARRLFERTPAERCPPPRILSSVGVAVGEGRLEADEAAALGVGDVVLLEGGRLDSGRVCGLARLEAARFFIFGRFEADGFHFERAVARSLHQEAIMERDAREIEGGELQVDVRVELRRLPVTLNELGALTQGSVLRLHADVSEPVTLRLDDRPFARGELVEIDGELGVRLLELLGTVAS